jgi:hypothetical protein
MEAYMEPQFSEDQERAQVGRNGKDVEQPSRLTRQEISRLCTPSLARMARTQRH